jgi:predicted dehydrogenase
MDTGVTRRSFVRSGAALAAGFAASSAYGANECVRVGVIGAGNRGSQLIEATLPHKDAQIVAVCDVYQPYLKRAREKLAGSVATYADYRKLLESKDVDVVLIATPDHWHAIQTIEACNAGKDVYVEKPLCYTVREGRRMVEVARGTGRIVQVGLQRRSSKMYAELRQWIQGGKFGKLTVSRAYRINNMAPNGIGRAADSRPPADLDWDLWLGPRPERPFNENIAPYKFRWWREYSSQMANWGVHYFDLLRWLMNETAPASVSAHGGVFAVNDDRTIPDTMQSIFEFASGHLLLFGQYEASGTKIFPSGEIELRGTLATVYAGGGGFNVIPERGGQFQDDAPRCEPAQVKAGEGDLTVDHIRNFLDCVKSRENPNADVEEGHRSTTFAHLANIALLTRSRLEWDAQAERITNNEAANELLHYEYRAPWKLG